MPIGRGRTKNWYQSKIWNYEKRRELYRERNGKDSEIMKYKVRIWKKAIRRIDTRDEKIKELDKIVTEFIGFSPKSSIERDEINDARMLFFKWGMENGIMGDYLSKYLHIKNTDIAAKSRLKFTRSFTNNSKSRDLWHRFIEYTKQLHYG